ncbi:unnamed protein product, partial [Bubo scandiacus]
SQERFPECFHGLVPPLRPEAAADKTGRSLTGSRLRQPLRGAGSGPRAGARERFPGGLGDVGGRFVLPRVHFQFPPRAPRSRGNRRTPALRTPPRSSCVPPGSGQRAEGSGQRALAPPRPARMRQLPALPPRRPSAARGSRGVAAGAAPGGPGGRSNSSPARRGRGRTRSPRGGGQGQRRPRGGAAARPGCPAPQLSPDGGARGGGRPREQQKKDLKVRRSGGTKWLSLPRQPVLTRRLHVGGKLQTSVENSNTPGTNNDKRNNNDSNDKAFPYIKS